MLCWRYESSIFVRTSSFSFKNHLTMFALLQVERFAYANMNNLLILHVCGCVSFIVHSIQQEVKEKKDTKDRQLVGPYFCELLLFIHRRRYTTSAQVYIVQTPKTTIKRISFRINKSVGGYWICVQVYLTRVEAPISHDNNNKKQKTTHLHHSMNVRLTSVNCSSSYIVSPEQ